MSVTLNEAALRFLLDDEQGPTGLDLKLRSENVRDLYRQNVLNIIPTFPPDEIDFEISVGDLGLQSVIGIRDGGRMAQYLDAKVAREPEKATDALDQGNHR